MGKNKAKSTDFVNSIYGSFLGNEGFRESIGDSEQAMFERMYMRVLTEMCVNRFKWFGLPEGVNARFLETTLFRSAVAMFYWDVRYSQYFALRASGAGPVNMYDDYGAFRVYGNASFQGLTVPVARRPFNAELGKSEGVPIYANTLRMPDTDIVYTYARRLAKLDKTIEIESMNARRSKVIVAEENMRLTAANINNEIERGAPVLWVNQAGRDLIGQMANVDLSPHPDSLEKIQLARTRVWNECMGLLGLNHANQDKKERLVSAEVSANDEQVENMRYVNLMERKRAAYEINKIFGLNIDVKYNVDLPTILENTGGLI